MKNRKLNELESRIAQLEREFNTLYYSLLNEHKDNESKPSYEEVIDLWLNGKEQH